jgi:predicted transposase YdaD
MPSVHHMVKSRIKELAQEGKLFETAFQLYQQMVFPNAGPKQKLALMITFFAGASEYHAVQMIALDEEDDITDADIEFMSQIVAELTKFLNQTLKNRTPWEQS